MHWLFFFVFFVLFIQPKCDICPTSLMSNKRWI